MEEWPDYTKALPLTLGSRFLSWNQSGVVSGGPRDVEVCVFPCRALQGSGGRELGAVCTVPWAWGREGGSRGFFLAAFVLRKRDLTRVSSVFQSWNPREP